MASADVWCRHLLVKLHVGSRLTMMLSGATPDKGAFTLICSELNGRAIAHRQSATLQKVSMRCLLFACLCRDGASEVCESTANMRHRWKERSEWREGIRAPIRQTLPEIFRRGTDLVVEDLRSIFAGARRQVRA